MNRIIAVVEGQTEQTFIRDILAPRLANQRIYITAQLIGRPGHKGGIGPFPRASADILRLIKQDRQLFVTTMFDFYGMPTTWPGRSEANNLPFEKRASHVEIAIYKKIAQELGDDFQPNRFIPYVQMHEYEALLFSMPSAITRVMNSNSALSILEEIKDQFKNPEAINDSPETAPSKRLARIFPKFRKPIHGVSIAKKIPFEILLDECSHFQCWIQRLEKLT